MIPYFQRLSLRGKLLLASILVEVIMLGLLVGNSVRLIELHMERLTEARIQAIELAYKTAVALPLASRDYATLRDILDGWRKSEDILYLTVTDASGRTLAASGIATDAPLPAPGPDPLAESRHVRFTVDYLGQVYGRVQYGLSTANIHTAKRQLFTALETKAVDAQENPYTVVQAQNEYRSDFKGVDHSGHPGVTVVPVTGNHCNIGGGYDHRPVAHCGSQ